MRRGKTPVLDPTEARQLIDTIDTTTVIGLRDRALIGLMVYSFARIGAAIGMRVEDVYSQNRRLWVRLHEKGGKQHAMPCHHNLESYLHAYIDGAGLASDPKALLFQTYSRATGRLTGNPLPQANAYAMIQRRARAAGITTKIGNHTFRATGVTAYLKNGGTLERAAQMANHASARTTQLYDRRAEEVTLDEVERILVRPRERAVVVRDERKNCFDRLSTTSAPRRIQCVTNNTTKERPMSRSRYDELHDNYHAIMTKKRARATNALLPSYLRRFKSNVPSSTIYLSWVNPTCHIKLTFR